MPECAWFFLSLIVTSSLFFLLGMLTHHSQQLCLWVTLRVSHLYSVDKSSDERWNGRLFMFKKSLPLYHVLTLTDVRETCSEREIMVGVALHDLLCAISLQHDLKIYTTSKI